MTGTPDRPVPGNAPPLRVLVADDQTTVREGLVTLLGLAPGIQVVGAAADGEQAITLTAELHPDVVLMDLSMPVVDGVTATARIRDEHPDTQVVVLTTFADDTNILAALRAGDLGYLTKDAGRAQIARALHTAAAGQAVLDPAVHSRLLAAASANTSLPPAAAAPLPDGLTAREGEVLALIAAGLTNTQIAGDIPRPGSAGETTRTVRPPKSPAMLATTGLRFRYWLLTCTAITPFAEPGACRLQLRTP